MSSSVARGDSTTVDMQLEVAVVPVSDVDRAKDFYVGLGWQLDADFHVTDGYRIVHRSRRQRLADPGD